MLAPSFFVFVYVFISIKAAICFSKKAVWLRTVLLPSYLSLSFLFLFLSFSLSLSLSLSFYLQKRQYVYLTRRIPCLVKDPIAPPFFVFYFVFVFVFVFSLQSGNMFV